MSARAHHPHAGYQLHLAVHLGQLARGADCVELLDLHDACQPQLVTVGGLSLVTLDDVAGVGEVRPPVGTLTMPPAWS